VATLGWEGRQRERGCGGWKRERARKAAGLGTYSPRLGFARAWVSYGRRRSSEVALPDAWRTSVRLLLGSFEKGERVAV
jgi:hypothetical protein